MCRVVGAICSFAANRLRNPLLAQEMFEKVRIFTCVPQNLGLGATTLEQKVAALVFNFFLEVGTLDGLRRFLRSFVSFTTDMGTEMGTASFLTRDVRELLPSWLRNPFMAAADMDNDEDMLDQEHGRPMPLMPAAIIVPGCLHITSNLSKDISGQLSCWPSYLKQLKQLEALLSVRDRRDRFVRTCVGEDSAAAAQFKSFSGSLYEARWGAVVDFAQKLHPLIPTLKAKWAAAAYSRGYIEHGADDVIFNPAELTEVLEDPVFEAYTTMILILYAHLEDLTAWFEGCPCHEHLLVRTSGHLSRRAVKQEIGVEHSDCPMKGKRAPQLAAGSLQQKLDEMWSAMHSCLQERIGGNIIAAAPELARDFEAGWAYLQMGLQVKLDFWLRLPWKLAGMGHHDLQLARSVAQAGCRDVTHAACLLCVRVG